MQSLVASAANPSRRQAAQRREEVSERRARAEEENEELEGEESQGAEETEELQEVGEQAEASVNPKMANAEGESAATETEEEEAEEDEGPTIEDFFRDISKVLNKYGEFSWDSQLDTYYPDDLMIFFKGTLKPHNDANYFFQYDEDFSE